MGFWFLIPPPFKQKVDIFAINEKCVNILNILTQNPNCASNMNTTKYVIYKNISSFGVRVRPISKYIFWRSEPTQTQDSLFMFLLTSELLKLL